MSMDPRDRVLECALEELLGGKEEGTDLAPRILEALERGDPAVPVSLLEDPPPLAPAPSAPPVHRLRVWRAGLWAAAALVLVALSAALWRAFDRAPAPPRPLAVAASPVLLLRGPGYTADFATAIEAGDRIVVPFGPEVEFQLRSGDTLVAAGGTLFATERGPAAESHLALLLGSLRIVRPAIDAPLLDLDTGFARLQAAPGALFQVDVEPDPSSLSPKGFTDPNVARELFRKGLDLARLLTVTVKRGPVEFTQGAKSELLGAGEVRRTWSEDPVDKLWTEKGEQEVLGHLAKIGDAGIGGKRPLLLVPGLSAEMGAAARSLSDLLARRPQYWTAVEEDLLGWVRDPRVRPAALAAVIEFLVRDGTAPADALGRELWLHAPGSYADHHLVHYADRGYFEFQRELSATLEAWREDGGLPPVFAAAALSRRGDREAIDALLAIVSEEDPDPRALEHMLLAAYALHAIGDQSPWQACLPRVKAQVEAYLEGDATMAAAWLVLLLQFLDDARQRQEPAPLDTLPWNLDEFVQAEQKALAKPAAIRARLAELSR